MLNIYKYYDNPKTLPLHEEATEGLKWIDLISSYMLDDPEAEGITEDELRAKIQQHLHIISKSAEASYLYADYILHHRFPEGEKAISSKPPYALDYCISVLAKDPNWKYKSGRWPEAEPAIMRSSVDAVSYAKHVLAKEPTWPHKNGQWPEAEPYIMQDPEDAFYYVMGVRKARWPEAEKYIMRDEDVWNDYTSNFKVH